MPYLHTVLEKYMFSGNFVSLLFSLPQFLWTVLFHRAATTVYELILCVDVWNKLNQFL